MELSTLLPGLLLADDSSLCDYSGLWPQLHAIHEFGVRPCGMATRMLLHLDILHLPSHFNILLAVDGSRCDPRK